MLKRFFHSLSVFSFLFFGGVFAIVLPTHAESAMIIIPTSLQLTYHDQTKTIPKATIRQWYTSQTMTRLQTNYREEIEKPTRCPIPETLLCDLIFPRTDQLHLHTRTQSEPDEAAIQNTLEQLVPEISQSAVEPKFTLQDGKVTAFVTGQAGFSLDVDASLAAIRQTLSIITDSSAAPAIPLALKTIEPSSEGINENNLGIVELISEGRTSFVGSPKNRIHNFTLGAKQFNGLLIKPGEEFSFVQHLGEVDGEHGYLPELVIKQNKTEPEFGGGICQVSTTAFRAALNAGLKITARHNHAYPVSYYKPYGMDATVYIPKPDLRFVNNTPSTILIQTAIEGKELVFRFYGTSDGRKITIDGPHIIEHNPDGSMKTLFTQTVVDAQGNTLINDKFNSNYQSPSLFPHPGQDPVFTSKPSDWSQKQWGEYKKSR
jgi:vancomycin resistance protein YoaR